MWLALFRGRRFVTGAAIVNCLFLPSTPYLWSKRFPEDRVFLMSNRLYFCSACVSKKFDMENSDINIILNSFITCPGPTCALGFVVSNQLECFLAQNRKRSFMQTYNHPSECLHHVWLVVCKDMSNRFGELRVCGQEITYSTTGDYSMSGKRKII